MAAGELEKIARLRQRFDAVLPSVDLGVGDDAAVLDPRRLPEGAGTKLVWTIDEQVEGTHFRRAFAGWADVGFRSFMAAASDLAAMGAEPWCALSALALATELDDEALDAIAEGQRLAADGVGAPVVGGNLTRAGAVSITTTLLGWCARPVTRRGAKPGDRLLLSGPVGLARAGLLALERGAKDRGLRAAIAAWLRPVARIADGRAMGPFAHAAIDLSDGLAGDAAQVGRASGVALVLDEPKIVACGGAALADAARALGERPIDLALTGGEDYALLVASDVPISGFQDIGVVREGEGVLLRSASGAETAVTNVGFDHFAAR